MPTTNEIIDGLLTEFKTHRDAIMIMIEDIEKLKTKIDTLIPDTMDKRYIRFFEEKVKTASEFFRTLLEMRKEIQKSLKDEIELRRKTNIGGGEVDIEEIIDIRKMADKVEQFSKKKAALHEKTVKEAQAATDEISEEVRKINAM